MKQDIDIEIEVPQGVDVSIEGRMITAKGPKGEVSKKLSNPKVSIEKKGTKLSISSKNATKREKTMMGTFKSHIRNMIQGVSKGFVYKLKIASTHFPMTASVNNGELSVQNFLGEKVPRTYKLRQDVDVKVDGQEIIVKSPDKEAAGQTAASIEQLCRITNRDRRIFQDGIYIISKAENEENE